MQTQIHVGGVMVMVEVADTAAARERGLSGHAPLKEQEGMLFVFESDEHWGIWMKDMHFAIDIVWADAQGKILTIAERAAPETYPQTFSPTAPARYVLELPAGFVERHGIAEGDQIVI